MNINEIRFRMNRNSVEVAQTINKVYNVEYENYKAMGEEMLIIKEDIDGSTSDELSVSGLYGATPI